MRFRGGFSIGRPRAGFYPVKLDEKEFLCERATSILDALAKPGLMWWAANEERKLILDASFDAVKGLAGADRTSLEREAWEASVLGYAGAKKAHQRISRKAKDTGTLAHELVRAETLDRLAKFGRLPEEYRRAWAEGPPDLSGIPKETAEAAQWAMENWKEWADRVAFEPLAIEERIADLKLGVGGTFDTLARVEGSLTIVDYKTAKAIYDEAILQVSFYAYALDGLLKGGLVEIDGTNGFESIEGLIVRLPKNYDDPVFDPKKDVVRICRGELAGAVIAFAGLREAHRWLAAREAKRKPAEEIAARAKRGGPDG